MAPEAEVAAVVAEAEAQVVVAQAAVAQAEAEEAATSRRSEFQLTPTTSLAQLGSAKTDG